MTAHVASQQIAVPRPGIGVEGPRAVRRLSDTGFGAARTPLSPRGPDAKAASPGHAGIVLRTLTERRPRIIDAVSRVPREVPSPVRLVRVDLDAERIDPVPGVTPGAPLWMEVSRVGQVVGVVESVMGPGGIPETSLDYLREVYSTNAVADLRAVADDSLPPITVVIPTVYRRIEQLRRTVHSVASCDYPTFEIVVVDNRANPGEPIPPFAELTRVTVIAERTPGISAARNAGVRAAEHAVVAFTDDDVEVDRDWLRAIGVAFAADPAVGVIGGMVRPKEIDTQAQLWFEEYLGGFTKSFEYCRWSRELVGATDPLFPYSAGHFGSGNNIAMRRTVFDEIGGFDESLGVGTPAMSAEDHKMFVDALLAGSTVAYVPSALVRHSHRRTEKEFLAQIFGYSVGLTALYAALIVQDRRHLWEIARRVPLGVKMFFFSPEGRRRGTRTTYPGVTNVVLVAGMLYGPLAYARSKLSRRQTQP